MASFIESSKPQAGFSGSRSRRFPYPVISRYARAPRPSARSRSSSTKTAAPSDITPESRSISNGRLAFSGSPLRHELSPLAIKLPITKGVMGASVPPAIASSASPERIRAAASAIASRPDGQADETVAACAEVPILSAIVTAGACGIEAADVVAAMRLGPCSWTV